MDKTRSVHTGRNQTTLALAHERGDFSSNAYRKPSILSPFDDMVKVKKLDFHPARDGSRAIRQSGGHAWIACPMAC